MTAMAGPYLAGCLLLAAAGLAKIRGPASTRLALAGGGRRGPAVPAWAVRVGGGAELALGTAALVTGAPGPAAVVALCYLAFTGFVAAALAGAGGAGGCGCFGAATEGVPVGPLHAAVNLALATAAVMVSAGGGLHAPPLERAMLAVAAAGLAWVAYLVLAPLPRLVVAVRDMR